MVRIRKVKKQDGDEKRVKHVKVKKPLVKAIIIEFECPECNSKNPTWVNFCMQCGHKFKKICLECGEHMHPRTHGTVTYCSKCGKRYQILCKKCHCLNGPNAKHCESCGKQLTT